MAKDLKALAFQEAKHKAFESLEELQESLDACLRDGMADPSDSLYNELLGLMDDVDVLTTWDEMEELISKAEGIESDVGAYMARRGVSTMSLEWPKPPSL